MNDTVELAWDSRCATGESPVWDAAARRVLFCDIPHGRIHTFGVDDGSQATWQLPEPVGSFGLCRSGRLVVALRHRIVLFDPRSGEIATLAEAADEPETNRFNDGKIGPDGCFWGGSMDERPEKQACASLYRVTPDGQIERKAQGYVISNGLAWSPDGRTMYHSDSKQARIDAWDFDPSTGRIGGKRRLATLTDEDGRPDGGATDVDGCYWSSGVSAGCLNRFSPSGALLAKIAMPVPSPTMPCFAEDALFVTSLRAGGDDATVKRFPTSGGLFRLRALVTGSPVGMFADG